MDQSIVKSLLMKPSQAIREGAKLVREYRKGFLFNGCGCAVGMMAAACGATCIGDSDEAIAFLKGKVAIDPDEIFWVSNTHFFGYSANDIANVFEQRGR